MVYIIRENDIVYMNKNCFSLIYIVFFIIGIITFLQGCGDFKGTCVNFKVYDGFVSDFIIENKTCSSCIYSKTKNICEKYEYYECWNGWIVFDIENNSTCNLQTIYKSKNYIDFENVLGTYKINEKLKIIQDKKNKKCNKYNYKYKSNTFIGIFFMVASGILFLTNFGILFFCVVSIYYLIPKTNKIHNFELANFDDNDYEYKETKNSKV